MYRKRKKKKKKRGLKSSNKAETKSRNTSAQSEREGERNSRADGKAIIVSSVFYRLGNPKNQIDLASHFGIERTRFVCHLFRKLSSTVSIPVDPFVLLYLYLCPFPSAAHQPPSLSLLFRFARFFSAIAVENSGPTRA